MKFDFLTPLACILFLASCEKSTPAKQSKTLEITHPILASAQFALAKNHINIGASGKAIPYLQASLENAPSQAVQKLLTETLASTVFEVSILQLTHPYPVLFHGSSQKNLYVALGGPHPTVIRWDLTEAPKVAAVLFPTVEKEISAISLSPNGKYLLVHRDKTNLLCLAESLKPIINLGTFPENLALKTLQPFSQNSLLLAHPTLNGNFLTWHIRDAATGDILRSETFPLYPKPTRARFQDTTLILELEDHTETSIPLIGDIQKRSAEMSEDFSPQPPSDFTYKANTITRHLAISLDPSISQSLIPASLDALIGFHLNPTTQSLEEISVENRLQILSQFFPNVPSTLKTVSAQTALDNRFALAYPEEFPDLTAPDRAHAQIIRETFATGDSAAISAVIAALPPSGLPTATALFLSLKSGNPNFIRQVLAIAKDVPTPLLSRNIPIPPNYRNEQDWKDYESPDFSEILNQLHEEKATLLTQLRLPEDPTEEDVQAFITHLISPKTQQQLPKETLAFTAITAAHTLSKDHAQAASALQLTALAQRLGTPQPEILRTQATAFTSLADFKSAHRAWLDLITNQPEATHLPSDYSEAAYTAFETSAPDQAAEILRTGLFRFQKDVALAIRAGWIALLTDYPTEAVQYLNHATTLGLPPAEIENTTALLAIAHTQLDDPETAAAYLEQLKAIDEKWADPTSIEKLPWPEPLKDSLRQLYPLDLILPE